MNVKNQQNVREAIQNLLDYTHAVLHIKRGRLVNDCAERCKGVGGPGSTQTFYKRMQSPIDDSDSTSKKFFSRAELLEINAYFSTMRIDNKLVSNIDDTYRKLVELLDNAIAVNEDSYLFPPKGVPQFILDRGSAEPESDVRSMQGFYMGQNSSYVPVEKAVDKDYGEEIAGATSVKMVFLTGRTIIGNNKQQIREALINGTQIQIVFVDPDILSLLPEETCSGLCPLSSLLNRILASIEDINCEILKDLEPEVQRRLEVRFTKAIPTTHMVLIEKNGQTTIWYTPYLPGILSRWVYRYIFTDASQNIEQFVKSFEYVFDHSRNVLDCLSE